MKYLYWLPVTSNHFSWAGPFRDFEAEEFVKLLPSSTPCYFGTKIPFRNIWYSKNKSTNHNIYNNG